MPGLALPKLLDDVEIELDRVLGEIPGPEGDGCRRVVESGGKRLRPDLLLRAALAEGDRPVDGDVRRLVAAATAIELLHSATLVHDDLLDDSDTRRGVVAVHRQEGPDAAVLGGDALIAHSWMLVARLGPEESAELAAAFRDMCSGEVMQARLRYSAGATPDELLRVAELKTGALIRAACRIGGSLAGANPAVLDALAAYGSDFGIALQLIDDVLDVVSDRSVLGKPCWADFAAGTVTMPMALTMNPASSGPKVDPATSRRAVELRQLLRPDLDQADVERAYHLVLEGTGTARTIALARWHASRAGRRLVEASGWAHPLSELPMEFVKRSLESNVLPDYQPLAARAHPDEWALAELRSTG